MGKNKFGKLKEGLKSWGKSIAIGVAAAALLNGVVLQNAYVPSESMESTLMVGDRMVGSRIAYALWEPERGDVATFWYPVDDLLGRDETLYVKRVIGLPGETIEIRDGKIYVDGADEPLDEPYVNGEWTFENGSDEPLVYEVPEGCYFMLGDNRDESADSRFWAAEAAWDAEEEGVELTDAEIESATFVKRERMVAKMEFVYWPLANAGAIR